MTDINEATIPQLKARLAELERGVVLAAEIERAKVASGYGMNARVVILRGKVPRDGESNGDADLRHAHFNERDYPELYEHLRRAILDVLDQWAPPDRS